ncbi:MAG: tRNA uridine-5-carboxymethylaminomethyl(34) synthesis GTPase MnmE [Thermoanaerobaculia bacterium]
MRPSDSFLDTIVALATPAGKSAVSLLRLSGPDSRRILAALAPGLPGDLRARRPYLAGLEDASGERIDRALATWFSAPRSYTGEDVVELSLHGSPVAVARAIEAAIAVGARPARPGEFTERAFRAGKLDLVRAEAVRDLIEAKTPAAARFSARRLEGGLSRRLEGAREDLLSAAAGLAAAIDFSDDVGERVAPEVERRLRAAADELARLSSTYRTGRLLGSGCRVAILGRPNAGKSTLFNALVGSARAIVTEVPGTTRDTLEALVEIRGIPVTLVDTAGLRATEDVVEKIGVARAHDEAERADALLYVYDASEGLCTEDREALERRAGTPRLLVANKTDRAPEASLPEGAVPLCGLDPAAGETLRELLSATVASEISTEETSEVLGSLRQKDLVDRARRGALETLAALSDGHSPEYAATHCHAALDALADLVGETTSEDVLTRLFSTFCIGK